MTFKRILLINPSYAGSHWGPVRPPVGLGYLSEELRRQGLEHRVMDMSLGYRERELFSFIKRFKPDLVGFSLLTFRYRDSYNLIRKLKERFPSMAVVVGGPHVSMYEKRVLEEAPFIDYGLTREGERSLIEFCQAGPPGNMSGFIFRSPFIEDLDSLSFPRYRHFPLHAYVAREIGIITSRGCPYGCIFCPVKDSLGKKFRPRSAGGVAEEIAYWAGKGYQDIIILDDNFTLDEERVYEICLQLEERKLKGLRLRLSNGVRADRVNEKLLSRLWQVGFRYLSFGVEGGNNRVLKAIGKGETIEEIREAVSLATRVGFEVTLFFLVGSPEERRVDIEDSVRLAREFPVFDAKFYNLIPFPRTRLFDWVKENDFFLEEPEEYLNNGSHWDSRPVFATPWFTRAQRREALIYTQKVRREIRKKAIECRLKSLGPLAPVAAWLFSLEIIQDILQSNRFIRRFTQDFFNGFKNSPRT